MYHVCITSSWAVAALKIKVLLLLHPPILRPSSPLHPPASPQAHRRPKCAVLGLHSRAVALRSHEPVALGEKSTGRSLTFFRAPRRKASLGLWTRQVKGRFRQRMPRGLHPWRRSTGRAVAPWEAQIRMGNKSLEAPEVYKSCLDVSSASYQSFSITAQMPRGGMD